MKIVLTGATGFVGSEVLAQLLQRTDVDRVTCLTRRPLAVAAPKLSAVLQADFTSYPDEIAQELAEHDALIWALGGKASDEADPAAYERITCTATHACATAIADRLTHSFRFGYLSGMGADPTETATFPWQRRTRHLKGRTERSLHALTERHPHFRATCFRPGGILPQSTSSLIDALLAPVVVRIDRLAIAMIDESVRNVAEKYAVLNNSTIRKIADPSH
jgi:nucleoside-diphosphate-sugar epimerase